MKKIIYLLFFLPLILVAGLNMSKINSTLSSIAASKPITFFNADSSINLKGDLIFTTIDNADIILFPKELTKVKNIGITGSYKSLRDSEKYIGAIYLRKERTQIVFIKERLESNHFTLPDKYKKHIITECQLNPICLLKL